MVANGGRPHWWGMPPRRWSRWKCHRVVRTGHDPVPVLLKAPLVTCTPVRVGAAVTIVTGDIEQRVHPHGSGLPAELALRYIDAWANPRRRGHASRPRGSSATSDHAVAGRHEIVTGATKIVSPRVKGSDALMRKPLWAAGVRDHRHQQGRRPLLPAKTRSNSTWQPPPFSP